jgi:hypothetical protein
MQKRLVGAGLAGDSASSPWQNKTIAGKAGSNKQKRRSMSAVSGNT